MVKENRSKVTEDECGDGYDGLYMDMDGLAGHMVQILHPRMGMQGV